MTPQTVIPDFPDSLDHPPQLEEVNELLKGSSEPSASSCMAMALRRKGCLLRDIWACKDSVSALQVCVQQAPPFPTLATFIPPSPNPSPLLQLIALVGGQGTC
jgi:hypothetical protein